MVSTVASSNIVLSIFCISIIQCYGDIQGYYTPIIASAASSYCQMEGNQLAVYINNDQDIETICESITTQSPSPLKQVCNHSLYLNLCHIYMNISTIFDSVLFKMNMEISRYWIQVMEH